MSVKKILMILTVATVGATWGSWYWPFGSDEPEKPEPPRLSELLEPASLLIDEASDLAGDGKATEAIEKYRAALGELDRIENENPERVQLPEFASVRNKRAYVNAAIDSLVMSQVQGNARAVAVSDTAELEKRLAKERKEKAAQAAKKAKMTKRQMVMDDLARGDYASAELGIRELLAARPNDALALNLRAVLEMMQGRTKDAEATLDQAIISHPRSYYAYYNMAKLMLQQSPPNKATAKRYYETGRAIGGPIDAEIEGGCQ